MNLELGGYFEPETHINEGVNKSHDRAPLFVSGRSALLYILSTIDKKNRCILLPYFICGSLIDEIINHTDLHVKFYHIDSKLMPQLNWNKIPKYSTVLLVNYFGLLEQQLNNLIESRSQIQFIIDTTQGAYFKPLRAPSFNSLRKFFGVLDGAEVHNIKRTITNEFQQVSFIHTNYGKIRKQNGAQAGYKTFLKHESEFVDQSIKLASNQTSIQFENIDINLISSIRKKNFNFLFNKLSYSNKFKLEETTTSPPLCFPYLIEHGAELKRYLIKNKIYIPTYWPEVLDNSNISSWEKRLVTHLICLPIDQRYDISHMAKIIQLINRFLDKGELL